MESAGPCAMHGPRCTSPECPTVCSGGCQGVQGRRGHHTTNLLDTLRADGKERDTNQQRRSDLELLQVQQQTEQGGGKGGEERLTTAPIATLTGLVLL